MPIPGSCSWGSELGGCSWVPRGVQSFGEAARNWSVRGLCCRSGAAQDAPSLQLLRGQLVDLLLLLLLLAHHLRLPVAAGATGAVTATATGAVTAATAGAVTTAATTGAVTATTAGAVTATTARAVAATTRAVAATAALLDVALLLVAVVLLLAGAHPYVLGWPAGERGC